VGVSIGGKFKLQIDCVFENAVTPCNMVYVSSNELLLACRSMYKCYLIHSVMDN